MNNPTASAEWTPRYLQDRYEGRYAGIVPWCSICEDHNAAIAAEREAHKLNIDAVASYIEQNQQLKQQLAAEREAHKLNLDAVAQYVEQNQQLREQLAAEREQGVKALAERSFELHECQKQLAALAKVVK